MNILELLTALQILQDLQDPMESLEALRSYENPQEPYGAPSARRLHRGPQRAAGGRMGMGTLGGMSTILGIPSGVPGTRGGFSQSRGV